MKPGRKPSNCDWQNLKTEKGSECLKMVKKDPGGNTEQNPLADPTTPGRGPQSWWMPRALPGPVSGEEADVALLLSRSPYPAPFSCGDGSLCDQGQEEVGEGYCSVVGP